MPLTIEKKNAGGEKGGSPASRAWLWSLLIIAGAFAVLSVSVLSYVMNVYKFIYPNVYADDIRLGGLSAAQADQLVVGHIREKLSGFSVTLESHGVSYTFTPESINAEYDAGAAARQAYEVGREGGFFRRVSEIFNAYFSRVDVTVTPKLNAGREIIAERAAALAELVNTPVRQYSYVINEKDIVIQNASEGRALNQAAAVDGVLRLFERLESGTVALEPDISEPEPLDIENLRALIYREPENAYLEAGGDVKIIPHRTGVDFNAGLLLLELQTDKPEIIVPLIFTEPEITSGELREVLFRDELSSFTTYLSASNVPRTDNIRLASEHINGTIILPGGVFSFNETVGQRTAERGFQEAGAYVNGRLVPELGGGVCQMSTTAYNAALFADLKIVERSNHSMTVSYVNLGQDAMVNWGSSDLKFENDTLYPIQIFAVQSGNSIRVAISGTKTVDKTVEIERVTVSSTPYRRTETLNPDLAPGTSLVVQDGYNGYVVETYRIIKDAAGEETSRRREAKSTYRKVDLLVETGPPPPPGTPTSL